MSTLVSSPVSSPVVSRAQAQRLRLYQRCGWPCCDTLDLDLLAAGLIARTFEQGFEVMRLSDAGLIALHAATQRNRAARDRHEQLIDRLARQLAEQARLVFRGLSFRVRGTEGWHIVKPDLLSMRRTTVEDYLQPQVYEIKARRADLLGDLRRPEKRAGYLALAGACSYVLAEGIGTAEDIPAECGVIVERAGKLETLRAAPVTPRKFDFATWMVLAQAGAEFRDDESPQDWLTSWPSDPADNDR